MYKEKSLITLLVILNMLKAISNFAFIIGLEKIIVNNFGSNEFFINKAIGWSLRDYSKTNPKWVKEFVGKYKDKMDKLSIKEASKYI